jgi:hypothetical protein
MTEVSCNLLIEISRHPAPCLLDRRRRSFATEAEWRDPEDASSAMPRQGVLTIQEVLVLFHLHFSCLQRNQDGLWVELPDAAWHKNKSPGWFDLSSLPFAKLRGVRPALTMTEVSGNPLIESFLATRPLVISTDDEGALRLRRSGETPRMFRLPCRCKAFSRFKEFFSVHCIIAS